MDSDNLPTSANEAYAMSVSVALKTLNDIMTNESESTTDRIWAAEAVLENQPKVKRDAATSAESSN